MINNYTAIYQIDTNMSLLKDLKHHKQPFDYKYLHL